MFVFLGLIVAACLSAATAFPEITVVRPGDVPNWEHFDEQQLVMLQEMVEEGHQPWRQDPAYYAGVFIMAYRQYREGRPIDPTAMESVRKDIALESDSKAIVAIRIGRTKYIVDLTAPLKPYPEGIWVITGMRVVDTSA